MNLEPYQYSLINPLRWSWAEQMKRKTWRCEHRHNGLAHAKCYNTAFNIQERVGALDIETGGLDAGFDIVYCWFLKTSGKDEIWYDSITLDDLKKGYRDKRILENLSETLWKYDRIVTHYGCLAYGHKVLTIDLRWVNVEDIKVGDKLLGFDEEPQDGNKYRKFRESEVLSNKGVLKDVYKIVFSSGKIIYVTGEHPFLRYNRNQHEWNTVHQLYKEYIMWTLKVNILLLRLLQLVLIKEYNFDLYKLQIPQLKQQLLSIWDTDLSNGAGQIVSIEPAGKKMVAELGTSTATYIGEGLFCHNSNYRFDIPFARTRCIRQGIDFPTYGYLWLSDTYQMAKKLLCLKSNRQGRVAGAILGKDIKTKMTDNHWLAVKYGSNKEKAAALKYIKSHCEADVIQLDENYLKLKPFCREVRTSI